jgi:hypothetical protein
MSVLHAGSRRIPLADGGSLTLASGEAALSLQLTSHSAEPVAYALHQNYPNPFNSSTTFRLTVVGRQLTTVRVFDILGREVTTLVEEVRESGTHRIRWDAGGLSSGVYFCRMQAGVFSATRKVLLLR